MRTRKSVPILNANKGAVIHIKPLDVKRGVAGSPALCAAARACVHDLHAKAARVHVGRTFVQLAAPAARKLTGGRGRVGRGTVWVRFRTPQALRQEIIQFDRNAKFTPGTYELPPLQPSHRAVGRRIGGKSRQKPLRKGAARRRPAPRHLVAGVREAFRPEELVRRAA